MPLVVYFDEVGTPDIDPTDEDFPVFAIALVICDSTYYIDTLIPAVNRLKFKWFGHEGTILHSRDIRRSQDDFMFLRANAETRQDFYEDINAIMGGSEYSLLSVAIHKRRLAEQYVNPLDPYDLALLFALERLVSILEAHGQREVVIVAEQRGRVEDRNLRIAFQRIVMRGTEYVEVERFKRIRFTLKFVPKARNVIGTQRWTPSFGQVFVTAKVESRFMIQATLG